MATVLALTSPALAKDAAAVAPVQGAKVESAREKIQDVKQLRQENKEQVKEMRDGVKAAHEAGKEEVKEELKETIQEKTGEALTGTMPKVTTPTVAPTPAISK